MSSRVEDVMTTDVAAVREAAGYKDILAVMRQRHVSAVPVLDSAGHLAGVVSEADLLLKVIGAEALAGHLISTGRRGEQSKAAGVTAAELMSTPVVAIGPQESMATAARLMHDHRVKRLPVVDETGLLVGIVSQVDVLSVFARPDDQIRDEVIREIIAKQFALDPSTFDVAVTAGIVTVTGQADSRAVARQLTDAVRHVEGAIEVRDRITCPPAAEPEAAFLRPRYQHR